MHYSEVIDYMGDVADILSDMGVSPLQHLTELTTSSEVYTNAVNGVIQLTYWRDSLKEFRNER
jgi:hypothetical protein